MDSLTQIVLGAAVAATIAPARHRRAALLAGAALGTLPDLDVIATNLLLDDPVDRLTWHRGPSHSLFVLPLLAWAIWAFFRRRGGRVAASPRRWWWAILLALITHPLLDAFTVFGTQLLWPLPSRPVMWSSLFIIDPLYTLWLIAACVAAWMLREKRSAQAWLIAGLAISTAYIGWSLLAKSMADRAAARSLAVMGLADAPRFSVPMPFNTLLWRVVAMTPEGYVEGYRSVVADHGSMRFSTYPSDVASLRAARDIRNVQRLAWFNRDFQRAQVVDDRLVLTDLRMGSEPDYIFNWAVARRDDDGGWIALQPSEQLRDVRGRSRMMRMGETWQRIWAEPITGDAETQAASGTPAISPSK